MRALILQHPRATVKLDDPNDLPSLETVAAAKLAAIPQRLALGLCLDCGIPNRLHRSPSGTQLPCDVAAHVSRVSDQPAYPERWNDPRPRVTAQARAAMVDGTCGPEFEIYLAGKTNDEQLSMAFTLCNVVISAYIADLAQRGK
jgi:hypothetical protein